jgi:hypothetical protein
MGVATLIRTASCGQNTNLFRYRKKIAAKSDNFLFGTLALVALQMFGRTSGSVQGAKRVDVREGIRSVVEGEVSGCILSCC